MLKYNGQSFEQINWDKDVTLKTINEFESALANLVTATKENIILSLLDVQYMNSAGLGVLVDIAIKVRRIGKQIVLIDVADTLMEIFNIVKIPSIIKIFPNEDAAAQYYLKNND